MPIPAAAIAGGASVLGSIIGNIGSRKRQKKADKANIKFWQMQNSYNDPQAQMSRLKKAGLNPNLIYGQSVSGATGLAGAVAPSKAAPYSMDLGTAANNAMAAHQTQANVNNTDADTAQKAFDLSIDKEYAADTMRAKLVDIQLNNAKKVIENNVASETMRDRINLATENLAVAKATLTGKQWQNAILEWESEMKDMNISGQGWVMSILKFIAGSLNDTEYNNKNKNNSQADRGKNNKPGYLINKNKWQNKNY